MYVSSINKSFFNFLRNSSNIRYIARLATAAIACSVAPAYASNQAGTVTQVAFVGGTNGRFLFWVSGSKTATVPSCDCCARWEVFAGDAYGQALVSVIMTAYAAGKQVTVNGLPTPTCLVGANDTELVGYIQSN